MRLIQSTYSRIRPLNRKVADFIRVNPIDIEQAKIEKPWILLSAFTRDERRLRRWYENEETGAKKSEYMIYKILAQALNHLMLRNPYR